jgi:hypothetical protein
VAGNSTPVRRAHGRVELAQTPDIGLNGRKSTVHIIRFPGSTPEEFAAYIKSETVKWAKVVRDSGAKAE